MAVRFMHCLAILTLVTATLGLARGAWAVEPLFPLGPGDVLEISAWKDEELSRKVLVRPDGFVSFPLIGDIKAQGLSVEGLRVQIETKVREFVPDAAVTVILMEANSARMYVVGKVNKPGVFLMMGETTVVQALAWAGGPTTFASTDSIRIIRRNGGQQQAIGFDYDDLAENSLSNVDLSTNIVLHPGDTIIVP